MNNFFNSKLLKQRAVSNEYYKIFNNMQPSPYYIKHFLADEIDANLFEIHSSIISNFILEEVTSEDFISYIEELTNIRDLTAKTSNFKKIDIAICIANEGVSMSINYSDHNVDGLKINTELYAKEN